MGRTNLAGQSARKHKGYERDRVIFLEDNGVSCLLYHPSINEIMFF